jgi:non-canonical purine NTP pyrophosphatase (RdgB/HAM1 family)
MQKIEQAIIDELAKSGFSDRYKNRTDAHFVCVLSLCYPDGKHYEFEGKIHGRLNFPPRGDKGHGYDPIFVPVDHSETFAEMDFDYKNSISHRANAFTKLLNHLKTVDKL